jgi:hypothetical protein
MTREIFTPTLTLPPQGGGKKMNHLCKVFLGHDAKVMILKNLAI